MRGSPRVGGHRSGVKAAQGRTKPWPPAVRRPGWSVRALPRPPGPDWPPTVFRRRASQVGFSNWSRTFAGHY